MHGFLFAFRGRAPSTMVKQWLLVLQIFLLHFPEIQTCKYSALRIMVHILLVPPFSQKGNNLSYFLMVCIDSKTLFALFGEGLALSWKNRILYLKSFSVLTNVVTCIKTVYLCSFRISGHNIIFTNNISAKEVYS